MPLAVEFGKAFNTIGFDINEDRLDELRNGSDSTLEVDVEELLDAKKLLFTSSVDELQNADIYIVTVPTPINEHKQPDLSPLISASKTVGQVLRAGNIVIYESTVYPGATEEDCVPVLERESGLTYNYDFFCGYSRRGSIPATKSTVSPQ